MSKSLATLREKLVRMFSLTDIDDLCFELNVDHEDISGDAKKDRARYLIEYLDMRGRISELEELCAKLRPGAWNSPPIQQESPQNKQDGILDAELLSKRRSTYEALFRVLKPFSRYDASEELDAKALKEVSLQLRDWYFDMGGLYLSDECRVPYFALKEVLKIRIEKGMKVNKEEQHALVNAASRLRAFLREEVE